MTDAQAPLSADQVEAYLQQHPEFFHDHLGLLEDLSIPHPSGEAVSLISKQLEIFRSKHQDLENQLNALIEIARENDTAFNRMHELTLSMLEAKTLDQVMSNLKQVLSDCFLTDFVSVKVIREHSDDNPLFVAADDDNLKHFSQELANNQPKCGRLTLAQARFLFADAAMEVKSCAIIPMAFTELEGLLAIGSRDDTRFHYSMGHLFLTQMSEIVGTRLISILD
ncbi:DUF484 family protein [Methylomarinum sp. Ch1-1]|uniref:DUF484 family protein n=1 Tax=Methylomarinum roseum TaxID=3067653 RepID=A0AAU7NV92_9GAMM|nr:DUF484 family protein [Methylomarinum sp. Ch1-1]MDP4523042.1 DUF484 family protein [Methylomarinum sp. Ch1-1]